MTEEPTTSTARPEPLLADRVAIVTGAGRGLGRAHALELARLGAKVVVNDLGVALDGSSLGGSVADEVVDQIERGGGHAIANRDDVADWDGAERLVHQAIEVFGHLDAVVNNAGIVRDRMFANVTPDEWDAVVRVHLRGHFCVSRHAASIWRDLAKEHGPVDARIINTTSGAGLLGSVGQSAYSAAKAGIAGMTLVQAAELRRYGITVNAIAPSARTRMTETVFADAMAAPEDQSEFDAMAPENVSPLVAWLCSTVARYVTGRIFEVEGGRVTLMDGWQRAASHDEGRRLDAASLDGVVGRLLDESPAPVPVYGA
jgi:NAD(P)-dependent dehydrogenase (short-subunit alcohol dehydrogenase family)